MHVHRWDLAYACCASLSFFAVGGDDTLSYVDTAKLLDAYIDCEDGGSTVYFFTRNDRVCVGVFGRTPTSFFLSLLF